MAQDHSEPFGRAPIEGRSSHSYLFARMARAQHLWYLLGDSNTGCVIDTVGDKIPGMLAQMLPSGFTLVPLGVCNATASAGPHCYLSMPTFKQAYDERGLSPDGILLTLGTNDVHGEEIAEVAFHSGLHKILIEVCKRWPSATILVLPPLSIAAQASTFKVSAKTAVDACKASARVRNVRFVDVMLAAADFKEKDIKHLTHEGCTKIAIALRALMAPNSAASVLTLEQAKRHPEVVVRKRPASASGASRKQLPSVTEDIKQHAKPQYKDLRNLQRELERLRKVPHKESRAAKRTRLTTIENTRNEFIRIHILATEEIAKQKGGVDLEEAIRNNADIQTHAESITSAARAQSKQLRRLRV